VWTHTDRIGIWKCTNEAGYVVSEGSDDEYRTITVDQQYPWLGVGSYSQCALITG
jgi:hypothetical protein